MQPVMMRLPLVLALACLASVVQGASNYCAEFTAAEANKTTGYFAMQIDGGVASYTYNIDMTNFKTVCDISKLGMEYHLHTHWPIAKNSAATTFECGKTGLHYDPYLACGYESLNCTALGRVGGYTCTPSIFNSGQYAKCQVGDLSGKFGDVMATAAGPKFQQLTPLYDNLPPVAANHLSGGNSKTSMFSSVVFHCPVGKKVRLVCAKLQLVPEGQSSACSFPQTTAQSMAELTSDSDKNKSMLNKAVIAVIILAIIIFILFILAIVLAAKLCCCKKKPEVKLVDEVPPSNPIVGVY